ncbi:MAG: hypothetical protein SPF22_00220 [Candidatus Onthovivens sp.]|nr:hypothetical protein [Candidatus Onthovivens sp.]
MSILRKIPKIEQVLDNMSIESLKRLESLMNSGNGATDTYTLFGGENKLNYENKDLGVWYCNIELERNKSVETGFLIWESQTKALFISYDITQCLKEYEIDLTTYTYEKINEKLSIEEFRRVLEDNINKEVVHIDTTGNVEIGKNLVVDGKVILNGKEDLVDTSGNELLGGGGLTFPTISPSSQVIPSITTSNTQQNLTIGGGLAIENGELKASGEKTLTISITDILTDNSKIQELISKMASTTEQFALIPFDNQISYDTYKDYDTIKLDLSPLSSMGISGYYILKNQSHINGFTPVYSLNTIGTEYSGSNLNKLVVTNLFIAGNNEVNTPLNKFLLKIL